MGLKWLVFFIRPLDLIGMRFGEDQRANIINYVLLINLKEVGLRLQISMTTLHSIGNTISK